MTFNAVGNIVQYATWWTTLNLTCLIEHVFSNWIFSLQKSVLPLHFRFQHFQIAEEAVQWFLTFHTHNNLIIFLIFQVKPQNILASKYYHAKITIISGLKWGHKMV